MIAQSCCVQSSLPVFLSRHCRRPATPVVNSRSPTMSGVEYGPLPISGRVAVERHRRDVLPERLAGLGVGREHDLLARTLPIHRVEHAVLDAGAE